METVVSLGAPSDMPVGRVPKPRSTLSSSSSTLSWVAVKVKVLEVSVGPKVTLVAESE